MPISRFAGLLLIAAGLVPGVVEQMLGWPGVRLVASRACAAPAAGPPLLRAEGLKRGRKLNGVSLAVRRGEIVGLAGLLLLAGIFSALNREVELSSYWQWVPRGALLLLVVAV